MKSQLTALLREAEYRIHLTKALRQNFGTPSGKTLYPTILQLQTLNRCNGTCTMCPYSETVAREERKTMTEELFKKILDEIALWSISNRRPRSLILTLQNEPFLDSRLEQFAAEARRCLSQAWRIEITTNGSLIDGNRMDSLRPAAPVLLNISLSALTESTYSETMPAFDFHKTIECVEEVLNYRDDTLEVILRYVKQQNNAEEFRAFRKYWHRRGLPVYTYPANNRAGYCTDYENTQFRFSRIHRFLLKKLSGLFYPACPLLFTQACITAQGNVLLCCNDYTGESVMGNLKRKGLTDIFNSERYVQIRNDALNGKYEGICKRCSIYREWIA